MGTRLYTAAQVRELDAKAIATLGISAHVLMQRAAAAAWRGLRARWPQARKIVVLCGSGNNGGDGYLLACIARDAGVQASVIALAPPAQGDAERACAQWRSARGAILDIDETLPEADVYVDALFGTGLARPVEGAARSLIEQLNAGRRPVLALDVPSGISADSGQALGAAVRANNITFVAKRLVHWRGAGYCGEPCSTHLTRRNLYEGAADARLLDMRRMANWLPRVGVTHTG